MSVWTDDSGAVLVRRSSRRLSVAPSDVESISSSALSSASVNQTPRKLMHPKSSMIPRLKEIEEIKMASSDDELDFAPSNEQPPKRGRGRPRKDGSPARTKMTAIKTPASSVAAVKAAAAAAVAAAVTPSVKKEKTPPRSRSSSRSRRATGGSVSPSAVTPSASPVKTAAAAAPRVSRVLSFDEESPVVTRRSTRLATKTPSMTNGHANGSSVHENGSSTKNTVVLQRVSTEQWRDKFTNDHPFFTKIFIPLMICLFYAVVILAAGYYFDIHHKAPVWADMAAKRVNEMYDDFMARRASASAAAAADQV